MRWSSVLLVVLSACQPIVALLDAGVDAGAGGASGGLGGGAAGGLVAGGLAGGTTSGGSGGGAPSFSDWQREPLTVPNVTSGTVSRISAWPDQIIALVAQRSVARRLTGFVNIGSFVDPLFNDVTITRTGRIGVLYSGRVLGACNAGCETTLNFDDFFVPGARLCESEGLLTALGPADGGVEVRVVSATDQTQWLPQGPVPVSGALACVSGPGGVFVSGTGRIALQNGPSWSPETAPLGRQADQERWAFLVMDRATREPVAVSAQGAVARFVDGGWAVEPSGVSLALGVAARSRDDVFVLSGSRVRRRTGAGLWSDVPLPMGLLPAAIGTDGTRVFIGGSDATGLPAIFSAE